MTPGPMEQAARYAVKTANDFRAAGNFECLELVEIDAVDAVKRLVREGSPRLRHALVQAALGNAAVLKAA